MPLILRLSYGGASFLLAPELSEKGAQTLLNSGQYLGAVVVELPSNGAEKANSDDWLKATAPQVAVIEAEQGSRTAQPDQSVLDRLKQIPVYRTDQHGNVEIATDGKLLWISTR